LVISGLLLPTANAAEETVSVQLVKSISQAPYYIALGKGFFAQEGIKIEAGDVRSALDTVPSLATGRLDVSMGTITAGFFNAAHGGFDLRIVAALGIQGPVMSTQPVVRKALWDDGTIRSGKDLKGRKVAINAPGDITEYFLTLILDKYGMSLKDIDETPLAFASQLVAFKNGGIDAGFLAEPLSTAARMSGSVALMEPDAGVGKGTITGFVFYGTKFMHERPKAALGFLRALIRGAHEAQGDYNKDPALASIIAKETGIKLETIENSTPYLIDRELDIAKYEASMRNEETVQRKIGRLNYNEPLSFDKIIDATLVHEAAASLK
jgi:NitT/TauT family transport system substrate-binding protein